MKQIMECSWSPTGFAYAHSDGENCTCKIAAPPGMVLYEGELVALAYTLDLEIALAINDEERLFELSEGAPMDYDEMLASASSKIIRYYEDRQC